MTLSSLSLKEGVNVDNPETITHVSLCSGYGGIGLGLQRVLPALRDVAHVEIEAFAVANLVTKMEQNELDAAPIWTNLKTFDFRAFRGKVDILTGGYPCQPFSLAGKRLGKDDPRHLWPYIIEGIRAARPPICFFENVEGHISEGFREVQASLRRAGYRVEAGIFSAAEVGAPHQRKRLFILGIANTLPAEAIRELRELADTQSNRSSRDLRECNEAQELIQRPEDVHEKKSERSRDASRNGESEREREELADSRLLGQTEHEQQAARIKQPSEIERNELANPMRQRGSGRNRSQLPPSRSPKDQTKGSSSESGELPYPDHQRRNRDEQRSRPEQEQPRTPLLHPHVRSWPARPNEQQYEWEEPRTQPKMGRATNGFKSRVDSLRLLGNGVCPDTAEKAFRTLIKKFK